MNIPHSIEEIIIWMDSFNEKPKSFRKPQRKNASTVFLQLKDHYLELFLKHTLDEMLSTEELVRPETPIVFFKELDARINSFSVEEINALTLLLGRAVKGSMMLNELKTVLDPHRGHDFDYLAGHLTIQELAERCSNHELLNLLAVCIAYGKAYSLIGKIAMRYTTKNGVRYTINLD